MNKQQQRESKQTNRTRTGTITPEEAACNSNVIIAGEGSVCCVVNGPSAQRRTPVSAFSHHRELRDLEASAP